MAKPKLTTDRQVAALKAQGRAYETPIGGARGLIVRTFPSGSRVFELRYITAGGVRRRLPLGEYPALKLVDAVDRALIERASIVKGGDPAGERTADRRKARTGETLESLAESYFKAAEKGLHGGRGRPKRPSTLKAERIRFARQIKPALGDRRFAELSRSDIRQFMRDLATAGDLAADTVSSVGRTLSAILSFAVHEERLDANPATGLTRPLALTTRERMFPEASLAGIWKVLAAPPGEPVLWPDKDSGELKPLRVGPDAAISLALRFALLTLTRRQDVTGARWEEFDLTARTWTIPAQRHKSGRVHVVPLSETARAILSKAAQLQLRPDAPVGFVFPSPTKPKASITDHALTRSLTRLCASLSLPHGSPHDFRRTGATLLTSERGGVRRFVISKVLAHAAIEGSAVTEVYDRNEYLPDKRRALEAWEGLLLEIVGERVREGNVVNIVGAA